MDTRRGGCRPTATGCAVLEAERVQGGGASAAQKAAPVVLELELVCHVQLFRDLGAVAGEERFAY